MLAAVVCGRRAAHEVAARLGDRASASDSRAMTASPAAMTNVLPARKARHGKRAISGALSLSRLISTDIDLNQRTRHRRTGRIDDDPGNLTSLTQGRHPREDDRHCNSGIPSHHRGHFLL